VAKPKRGELPKGKITKADIEHKLRQVGGQLDEGAQRGRRIGPWVLGSITVIAVIYRFGVLVGSRRSPQLEIRRISP
jgi:hypothetical protein